MFLKEKTSKLRCEFFLRPWWLHRKSPSWPFLLVSPPKKSSNPKFTNFF